MPITKKIHPVSEVMSLVLQTLVRCGVTEQAAKSVATGLVGAELIGQEGHGIRRLPAYARQVLKGKIDGEAQPRSQNIRPGVLHIDAGHGFSYPAIDEAVRCLPAIAKRQGIAMALISRSHHCGACGLIVERLADQGMLAILFGNTPAAIAPPGGYAPVFGTNPIAFACPVAEQEPIVVDMALSKVARGHLMRAKRYNESIPLGWALNKSGQPTTDPAEGIDGTMVAMGDAKGAALALMVEVLSVALTGGNFAFEASSFLNDKGKPPSTGQMLIAIDAMTGVVENTATRIATLASKIEEQAGARIPGRKRFEERKKRMQAGIEIDLQLIEELESLTKK